MLATGFENGLGPADKHFAFDDGRPELTECDGSPTSRYSVVSASHVQQYAEMIRRSISAADG